MNHVFVAVCTLSERLLDMMGQFHVLTEFLLFSFSSQAPAIVANNRQRPDWPDSGLVQFKNYSVRYRADLDLVLCDISCDINAGEKVITDYLQFSLF